MSVLVGEIKRYWAIRSKGYSKVNQDELKCQQKERWLSAIEKRIGATNKSQCKILDIGTGPGFFSIILADAGYDVTAIDLTDEMLDEAKKNAGELSDKIKYIKMDAQAIDFDDNQFDVIVTRNLTWNLPNPEVAYYHWVRVLKKGGMLLNFDANWYCYLDDNEKREQYEQDRMRAAQHNVEDFYEDTDIDAMEAIARKLPLSSISRPHWDKIVIERMDVDKVHLEHDVWEEVWSEEEKINYTTTPMFLVSVIK